MLGPYRQGLGKRRINNSAEDEIFFQEHLPSLTSSKRRRLTQLDAEVIPKFDPGKGTTNVKGWLHKIDQLGDIYDWDDRDRIFVLQVRLRGAAREWYDDLDDYSASWTLWKDRLAKAFPRSTDFVDRLEEMLARKKGNGETMTKYYHDKMSLLKKCDLDGERATSCLIRGLPVELRANAKAYSCETPDELYYGYLSSLENYKKVETRSLENKSYWQRGGNTGAMPKICFNCRKTGHEARECRAGIRCQICHRLGHGSTSCWYSDAGRAAGVVSTERLPALQWNTAASKPQQLCQRSRAFLFLNEIQRRFKASKQSKKDFTAVLAAEMYRYSEDYSTITIRKGELDELNRIGVGCSESILGEKILYINNPDNISYSTISHVSATPGRTLVSVMSTASEGISAVSLTPETISISTVNPTPHRISIGNQNPEKTSQPVVSLIPERISAGDPSPEKPLVSVVNRSPEKKSAGTLNPEKTSVSVVKITPGSISAENPIVERISVSAVSPKLYVVIIGMIILIIGMAVYAFGPISWVVVTSIGVYSVLRLYADSKNKSE